jgi:glycosyltransferase involved in cell wall biosynthesis
MEMMPKIAIVVSHPIQHFCPQYVSFAASNQAQIKVFFGSALGFKKYTDKNFGREIAWGNLQLDKFDHLFLNGEAVIQPDGNLDAPSVEKELAVYQPDVVIVYGYFQKLQRRVYRWAVKNKVPLTFIGDSELRHKRSALKDLLKYFYLRHYFRKISFFLTVGNANEAYYTKYGAGISKFVRMHFPIDVNQYQKSYEQKTTLRNTLRRRYGIAENEIVLIVVGKLSPWKNQDHLIEAVKLLETKGVYYHLFILGSGEMKAAWEMKATGLQQSKIYFPGFVDIEALPSYYAASDIYVHPASVEPHSIAVSEAIYMGCPVIISDRCGSYGEQDDVQESKNGYIFEFGNIQQLAEKIQLLATNKSLRQTFGNYSHDTAVSFQRNAHYTVLENLLERVQTMPKLL